MDKSQDFKPEEQQPPKSPMQIMVDIMKVLYQLRKMFFEAEEQLKRLDLKAIEVNQLKDKQNNIAREIVDVVLYRS